MKRCTRSTVAYLLIVTMFLAVAPTFAQWECTPATPVIVTGSLEPADPDQTSRVFRGGNMRATTCLSNPLPAGAPISGTFNHDVHTVTSPGIGCMTVKVETACLGINNIFVVAYHAFNPANPTTGIIGNLGASPSGSFGSPAYFSFPVISGPTHLVVSEAGVAGAGCSSYTITAQFKASCRQPQFDRNHDGTADYAVFRPGAPSRFFNMAAPEAPIEQRAFGTTGDTPVHGDYIGDGATDIAVNRPGAPARTFYANDQVISTFSAITWGTTGDLPVVGDWDGDDRTDVAVYRPSTGLWYILRSSDNTSLVMNWGIDIDKPVSGDFDGDFRSDFAVIRTGADSIQWYVLLSNFNYSMVLTETGIGSLQSDVGFGIVWGMPGDKAVPGDWDGDGRTDVTVWRPSDGNFYYRQMPAGAAPTTGTVHWGGAGDIPQPADYDGDRRHDFAIFRPGFQAAFWVRKSTDGGLIYAKIGTTGDLPITSPYPIQ